MTYNPTFETPAPQTGEVLSHDLYTPAQLEMFRIIDGFGKKAIKETVEPVDETAVEMVDAHGQYL